MSHPVEMFCSVLVRSRLLGPEETRDVRQRWSRVAGPLAQNLDEFRAWLVSDRVVTEFQLSVIDRDNARQLFLGPYKIVDRIGKGRMAKVFEAVHQSGPTV